MFPRVKDIIKEYVNGGLSKVYSYLHDENMKFEDPSWELDIKNHFDKKEYLILQAKIELLAYKFKTIKNDDEKKNDSSTGTSS